MEPLIFQPILKRIRWGGRKLGSLLRKPIGPESDYAESWEIADQHSDQSVVASGAHQGLTMQELLKSHSEQVLGRHAGLSQFPLLIKYLDANDWLSLQVHPDDSRAKQYDVRENGKTEAWVILDAEPDAQIIAGLNPGVTSEELRAAIENNTVGDRVHYMSVRRGDCIFVPAGTVHALGPGVVLAEIQQQSNLTFRLTDWGRLDANGKPRPLHIQESIDCTDFNRGPVRPVTPTRIQRHGVEAEKLVESAYFVFHRFRSSQTFVIEPTNEFRILMGLAGNARISSIHPDQQSDSALTLTAGTTILLPAAAPQIKVCPEPDAEFLEIQCP